MPDFIDPSKAASGTAEWWLPRLERRLLARQSDMKICDDYYHGRHRMTYHTARVLGAFGTTFRDLRMNYCGVVVDSLNERLEVQGFRFGKDQAAADAAWSIWQRNRLEALFARGTRSGLTKREFSLSVWVTASGEPRIAVEDGSEVYVATNPGDPHDRRAAIKRWYDEDERRLYAVVYLADGIYWFRSGQMDAPMGAQLGELPAGFGLGGGAGTKAAGTPPADSVKWERYIVEGAPWPLPNPVGVVPVVPIPNKPDIFGVGESELAAIIPIQDAINANIVNVMLAGQFSAFRQRYASNVRLETDPDTGKAIEPWKIAVDSLLTAPPPEPGEAETKFGEFGQTDLSGYISLHEGYVQGMATISRTPPHYFLGQSGAFPSGESLRSAEAGLTFKARDRIRDNSDPVEEAMILAFLLKSRQAGMSSGTSARYVKWAAATDSEALWRDPETKTESEHVDALVKLRSLDVPTEVLWSKIPATPQEIQLWKAMPPPAAPEPSVPAPGIQPPA